MHGNSCTLSTGTTKGAWNTYEGTVSSGGVACTNTVFGDPLTGVVKKCNVEVTGDVTGWVLCAGPSETCSFTGTKVVKYGFLNSFNYQLHNGNAECTDDVFGDPNPLIEIFGDTKSCYVEIPMGTTWTECADEDATCSFDGEKAVRYGADGSYNYAKHDGGVSCTNTVFGDPIEGVVKTCSYADW